MSHIIIDPNVCDLEEKLKTENYPLSPKEHYQIVWNQISSEVALLNQKLSTLINSQAFLFLAYVSLLNSPAQLRSDFLGSQHTLLMWVFPLAAFFIASFNYLSMISSHLLILNLREHFKGYPKDKEVCNLPTIEGDRKLFFLSNASILVLPLILSFVWIVLTVQQWRRS